MQIQTTWLYSQETEAKRLLHTAHQIANHFYQINNLIVLPELPAESITNSIVIFPDLPFNKINSFWESAKKIDINDVIKIDSNAINPITVLLPKDKLVMHDVQVRWKLADYSVFKFLNDFLPEQTRNLKHINIFPTRYGSSCSFNRITKDKTTLEIYLRYDSGVGEIIEAIITSLTRDNIFDNLKGTWVESEIITDWIMTESAMKKIIEKYCPEYCPTIINIRNTQSNKIKEKSELYLKKLGFSLNHQLIKLKNEELMINNIPLKRLTEKEKQVLIKLIREFKITTEDLANILFTSSDDFSLYAMAKFIQRLRDKLELYGLTGSYIQTIRGFGYRIPNN